MQTILLVDDTKLLLELEKSFLANSQVKILTACDGEEALDVMRRIRPGLVVIDQHMPRMSGTSCCDVMKQDPYLKSIPVIIVSSQSSAENVGLYRRSGCDDFLAKPLQREAFLDKIHKFIPGIERRRPRVPCQVPVQIEAHGALVTGKSLDLSATGMYVATDRVFPAESRVNLSFKLPVGGDFVIKVTGRVAWLNSNHIRQGQESSQGLGIEFIEILGEGLPQVRKSELFTFIAEHKPATDWYKP